VGISRKAFMNEPRTTLPQFLHNNRLTGAQHELVAVQYHSTAFPLTQ
jgi:hypothetical protein